MRDAAGEDHLVKDKEKVEDRFTYKWPSQRSSDASGKENDGSDELLQYCCRKREEAPDGVPKLASRLDEDKSRSGCCCQ